MARFAFPKAKSFKAKENTSNYKPLPGSEIEPLPRAYIVGLPNPDRGIELTVVLRHAQGKAAEGHLISDQMGALPPHERKYLAREVFAATYRADPSDMRAVARFGRQHGLRVVGRHPAARTIHLFGTIANASEAFRARLAIFRHPGGSYRGRTGPVYVPAELEGIVQGVFGLDDRPTAKPHFRLKHQLGGVWPHASGISYTPIEVSQLYKFPTGANGAGQCIGIIELGGGFVPADLKTYFNNLGIPAPQVTAVSVNGGRNRATGDPNGPDGEVMLDIEVAGAVAPGAKIVVYFAPNTNQGFLRAINRAVHDRVHRPSVVSISWGSPEASWTQQALQSFNQAFQAAGQMGVTVCVASGDGGSSDGVPGKLAHVDFPSSSPYALACGGTRLEASGGVINSEQVWNDGPQGGAGGGGVSDFFALPPWQEKAGVPRSLNPGGHAGRGVPDLSGDADENTGYQVRVDGLDTVVGGTSAVAPLMAGLVALLNQKLGTPVGYFNPLLYTTKACHDITKGNNDMTGLVGGYAAGPGWDAASGLGSPDGTALLSALTAPKEGPSATGVVKAAPPVAVPQGSQEESSARKAKKEA
jgi:kumamolisin